MVVDVGGVQLQEIHLAALGLPLLLAVLYFALTPAAKAEKTAPSSGKKKADAKKKAQPKKDEKKPAKKEEPKKEEAKKEEPKKEAAKGKEAAKTTPTATPKTGPAAAPAAEGKKGKKAAAVAAKAAEEQKKKDEADGWEVSETTKSKKQKVKAQQLLANQEANVGKTAAPAATATKPQEKPAATGSKSTIKPLGFDFAKDAEETARRLEEYLAGAESGKHKKVEAVEVESDMPTKKIPLPREKTGVIVGPGGATITLLKEKTGVHRVDTAGGVCTIQGLEQEQVDACAKAVQDLVSKGYCELQYDDFSEQHVSAFPSSFPELIGQKGAIVRCIKENLNVEIQFPPTEPKGVGKGLPEKKLKVAIAGNKADVQEAKTVMTDILSVHHSELTHPGEIHQEVDVQPQHYAFIIGARGSELKHIQSNYKVRVFIPRGEERAPVLVVGQEDNVERAIKHIEKACETAESRAGSGGASGRADNGAGEDWGGYEDEDYEDWMKDYIIRRR